MKRKYILSMVASLAALTAASCKEDTTANAGSAATSAEVVENAGTCRKRWNVLCDVQRRR